MSQTQDIFGVAAKTVLTKPFFHARYQGPSGVSGASTVIGDNDIPLNSIVVNNVPSSSLNGDGVQLGPGKYFVWAECQIQDNAIMRSRLRIRNSAGVALALGATQKMTADRYSTIQVSGEITLNASDTIYATAYAQGAGDWGLGALDGELNVYGDIKIWQLDSNIETPVISDPTLTLARPMMHVQDRKPRDTSAGDASSGDNQRDLNTVLTNDIVGAALLNNSISLPAGTYYLDAYIAAEQGQDGFGAISYLKNSQGTKILHGTVIESSGVAQAQNTMLAGRFTLSTADTIHLGQWWGGAAGLGLGRAGNCDPHECYVDVRIWQLDAVIRTPVLVNDKLFPLPGNVMVTGNMHGLDYARTADNEVTIQAGICMDSTNETVLQLAAPQVLSIPAAASTVYHLFLCDDGFVRQDTDIDGANLVGYKIRWIGTVANLASGVMIDFAQNGDFVRYKNPEVETKLLDNLSNVWTEADPSGIIPLTRIKSWNLSNNRDWYGDISFDGGTTIAGVFYGVGSGGIKIGLAGVEIPGGQATHVRRQTASASQDWFLASATLKR